MRCPTAAVGQLYLWALFKNYGVGKGLFPSCPRQSVAEFTMPMLRSFAVVPHFLYHEVLLQTHSMVSVLPSDRHSTTEANYSFPLAPQRKVGTYGRKATGFYSYQSAVFRARDFKLQ